MSAHECHAEGCTVSVPPKMLMCRKHWSMVPRVLQRAIWATYRPGQERDKNPSAAYMVAQCLAREAVARCERRAQAAADCALQATMWRERAHENGERLPAGLEARP